MTAAQCVEWTWKYGQHRCDRPVEAGDLCDRHLEYEVRDLIAATGLSKAAATRRVISTPRSPHPFMDTPPVATGGLAVTTPDPDLLNRLRWVEADRDKARVILARVREHVDAVLALDPHDKTAWQIHHALKGENTNDN